VALPVYEVEFIPGERRLGERRLAPANAPLPPGVSADRRRASGRRTDDGIPAGRAAPGVRQAKAA
jgi:hypothetical protein